MTITIIGGCPGTGKTTLSKLLAGRSEKGLHLETDLFFNFIANKLDPSAPDAHTQNETVLKAWCAAARAYSDGEYDVFVDGVIGPWWFDQLNTDLGEYRYVMLKSDLQTCLERVASRDGQASATAEVVQRIHQQFVQSEVAFSGIVIETSGVSLDQLAERFDTFIFNN